jgi:hypothetical protein
MQGKALNLTWFKGSRREGWQRKEGPNLSEIQLKFL